MSVLEQEDVRCAEEEGISGPWTQTRKKTCVRCEEKRHVVGETGREGVISVLETGISVLDTELEETDDIREE